MFDYRFTRNATEYTERLRKEAHVARLARGQSSGLARFAARAFRSWANRLDGGNKSAEAFYQLAAEASSNERPIPA